MNGWQFMDEVRVHPDLRQVPIIVVSAYGSADGVRSVGATDYLKKPFDPETLLAVVWACPGSVDTQVRLLASARVGVRRQWD